MLNFFTPGGQLALAAAIYYLDLGAEPPCAARGIHGNVAAANYRNVLAVHDGSVAVFTISLHQVYAGKELVGGIYALQVFAGDVHKHGQTCAGADEHGLVAHVEQLVYGQGLAYYHVSLYVHAKCAQVVYFLLNYGLGKTEFRYAVYQHAAGGVQRFKYADLVAFARQIARAGEAGRAAADYGNLVTVGGGNIAGGGGMGVMPIGNKALQTAYADGFALYAAHALGFALGFLRANTAANRGQAGIAGNHLVCAFKVHFAYLCDEFGNVYVYRAAVYAGHILAVKAAGGLVKGYLLGVAKGNFFEIMVANVRLLGGHGVLLGVHVRHFILPPA